MNWPEATEHLRQLWLECMKAGMWGLWIRDNILKPLRERLEAGELTTELYKDIWDISL